MISCDEKLCQAQCSGGKDRRYKVTRKYSPRHIGVATVCNNILLEHCFDNLTFRTETVMFYVVLCLVLCYLFRMASVGQQYLYSPVFLNTGPSVQSWVAEFRHEAWRYNNKPNKIESDVSNKGKCEVI